MLVRRSAFERAGLARAHFDLRYNLTPDEFRVEGDLIAIGPLYDDEALGALTSELESLGLVVLRGFRGAERELAAVAHDLRARRLSRYRCGVSAASSARVWEVRRSPA